jgi:hypothetical protein
MARDHYVPASVLGRFSAEPVSRVRDRRLVVGRSGKVFSAKAESIGFVNKLYDVSSTGLWLASGAEDPGSVDRMISGYESQLPDVLDLLDLLDRTARVPLRAWLRVLVPFIAAMFVRGRDFGARFEGRPVVRAAGASGRDNTNRARLLELQRLLAPVTCARWVVLHQAGGGAVHRQRSRPDANPRSWPPAGRLRYPDRCPLGRGRLPAAGPDSRA